MAVRQWRRWTWWISMTKQQASPPWNAPPAGTQPLWLPWWRAAKFAHGAIPLEIAVPAGIFVEHARRRGFAIDERIDFVTRERK